VNKTVRSIIYSRNDF